MGREINSVGVVGGGLMGAGIAEVSAVAGMPVVVRDLPQLLEPGDILVCNDTRVIPAQLEARRGAARIGITLDRLTEAFGLSAERIEATIQQSIAWVLPNIALGAIIIVPVWVLAYILRPPGPTA